MKNELETVKSLIFEVRGCQVMLDEDLAKIYQVETKRLNEAVKRNIDCFPLEFMFQLTREEYENLKSQFATSSGAMGDEENCRLFLLNMGLSCCHLF